ncbi:MAG: hypothetical protein VX405_08950 [Myxococcota bacterium]|nr:hypothetical protein [Myxococcales bacterium]MBF94162.1 hypothetical protein [Myxococcales bacterium]MEC7751616.1 hypothetical protein [Myxococcota bacterium]|tara:strand:+ start:209 stop:1660 length:1452 start_codon:yes stop_codon:yes gene_type:complete
MTWLQGSGEQLGSGRVYPAGSVNDRELMGCLQMYRRRVASSYRGLKGSELGELPAGEFHVSPKVDGELWFLVKRDQSVVLIASNGRVLSGDLPLLKEASASFGSRAADGFVIAGELFGLSGKGRPRVGDVAALLGGDGDVARLGYQAFDVVSVADYGTPPDVYSDRFAELQRLLSDGKRVKAIKTAVTNDPVEIKSHYDAYVETGKAEGLVLRSGDGRVYKVKPSFTLDCVVLGFTERAEDREQARSLLLGLVREDGSLQLVGACGNLGSDEERKTLKSKLLPLVIPSDFRQVSGSGAMYRLVQPEVVVEVECTDLQAMNSSGESIERWAIQWSEEAGWQPLCRVASVSLIHPRIQRIRSDKAANTVDARLAQVSERCWVVGQKEPASATDLPTSELTRREVYTKEAKEKTSVRKLLVWKTNKEAADQDFPAYVVHWTDYSPGRSKPLKRTVRLAPNAVEAQRIADDFIASKIKKGWQRADRA